MIYKVATEYGLGQIVLANSTWSCPALPTDSVSLQVNAHLPESGGPCLPFLHQRPVYQVKVWQLTRQESVDVTKHTLHWLALLLYTD